MMKPKLNFGSHRFSYCYLVGWIEAHKNVPNDIHESFVIEPYVNIDDHVPSASIFPVII